MKIWLIYPNTIDYNSILELIKSNSKGANVEILFADNFQYTTEGATFELLYNHRKIALPKVAIVRTYDFALSSHLEAMGVRVVNNTHAMFLSRDKLAVHRLMEQNNIATPITIPINRDHHYKDVEALFKSEFIIKENNGSKGEGVFLVRSSKEFNDAVTACKGDIIAQEFIATSSGKDIRIWVVGSKVVGAVERYNDTSFKSNYSLGGKVRAVKLDPATEKLAVKSAEICSLEFAGVDLLYGKEGMLFCEINGNAGFRSAFAIDSNNNILKELFDYLIL